MSNFGQIAGAVVGGVIGFFVGGGPAGAIYGFQLGLLAGSVLFPTQLPGVQGPRLGDGQQTVSQVGQPIPAIFGRQCVGGNIIWASPIREVATTETAGGKGGPEQSQTTYSYFRSFAILLATREPDEGPIAGIRRIWANGKIIYDKSLPDGVTLADITNGTADPDVIDQFVNQQAVTSDLASRMTLYLGSEDQMPDPVIESFEGVGNVPGMRGYVYAVFDDVPLRPEDGNRVPASWKFELYENGTTDGAELGYYAQEVLYPWLDTLGNPCDGRNNYTYSGFADGTTLAQVLASFDAAKPNGPSHFVLTHGDPSQTECALQAPGDPNVVAFLNQGDAHTTLHINRYEPDRVFLLDEIAGLNCGTAPRGIFFYTGGHWGHGNADVMFMTEEQQCSGMNTDLFDSCLGCGNPPDIYFTEDNLVEAHRLPAAPPNPCDEGVSIPGLGAFCASGGVLYPSTAWVLDDTQNYHVLQQFVPGDDDTRYPLGPALPVGHAQDTEDYWTAAYLEAVGRGDKQPGEVYGVDYPETQDHGYKLAMDLEASDTELVSLASIVRRICNRASQRMGSFEFDVSDLEDKFVTGYQISRQMTARGAIEPLRSVGFFDVVESGIQLKFPTRGKAAVATLIDDDLGAHLYDEERPSLITTRKAQELELPRQIRVHYQNPQRDFDPGEELSPARFDTAAESVLDMDLAVAIDPDQAAKVAEVIYRDTWASRWVHEIQLDISQAKIESADCVIVPLDGFNQRVRVTALTDKLPNLRTLSLLRDDDGSYVSTAVGVTSQRPSNSILLYGPVGLELMDLPPLVLTHNDAGIYAASYPLLSGGAFRGAVISRSVDNGASYSIVGAVSTASPVGHVVTPLGDGPTTVFDEDGELRVEMEYGTLESRSEADVLDGANAAAVGINGRWEIVQFKTATLIAGKIYALTGLLRGRRGTEYNVGTGMAEDRFVMLDNVARLPMDVTEVGASRLYKAQPIASPQQGNAIELTGRGITRKPFSPVQIEGERDVDGNLTITWVRRDRLSDDTAPETEIVMSEDVLDFEVDILDADGERRRTISVSDPTAVYSDQMQIDDFGSLQAEVSVNIYQMSVQVGRGGPGIATL